MFCYSHHQGMEDGGWEGGGRGTFSTVLLCFTPFVFPHTAFFLIVSTILFGVNVDQDRDWLPHPDSTFLSWAYGFAILSAFLCLFAGMCMTTDFFRMRLESQYDRRGQSGGGGVARYAAPPPSYNYPAKSRY